MNFTDILVVSGLVALRIGVPVAITAALVYFLKRLDRRWEAEAEAERKARRVSESAAVQPAVQPARAAQANLATQRVSPNLMPAQPGLVAGAHAEACWEIKGCPESSYASCSAYLHPGQPCWQARLQAEGKIPDQCPTCEIFQRYPM